MSSSSSSDRQIIVVIDLTGDEPVVTNQSVRRRQPLGNITTEILQGSDDASVRRTRQRRTRNRTQENKENVDPEINTTTQGRGVKANDDDAYCVKCKKKQPMKNAKVVTTKNGRKALKGECSVCGTNMMKFIK